VPAGSLRDTTGRARYIARQLVEARDGDAVGENRSSPARRTTRCSRLQSARQVLGMPRRIIERRDRAGHAQQEKPRQLQRGDSASRSPRCCPAACRRQGRRRSCPSAPIEGDDAIARVGERLVLRRPVRAGAGVGVQQHDGHAVAASVGVPSFTPGKRDRCAPRPRRHASPDAAQHPSNRPIHRATPRISQFLSALARTAAGPRSRCLHTARGGRGKAAAASASQMLVRGRNVVSPHR